MHFGNSKIRYEKSRLPLKSFKRARVAVNVISSTDNLNGMDLITDDEKLAIKKVIKLSSY